MFVVWEVLICLSETECRVAVVVWAIEMKLDLEIFLVTHPVNSSNSHHTIQCIHFYYTPKPEIAYPSHTHTHTHSLWCVQ